MASSLSVKTLVRQGVSTHHESHKRILKQVESTISQQHRVGATNAWAQVPSWLYGFPVIDTGAAAEFVATRLKKGGFTVAVHHMAGSATWLYVDWGTQAETLERKERAKRNVARRKARESAPAKSAEPVRSKDLLTHLQKARKRTAKAVTTVDS